MRNLWILHIAMIKESKYNQTPGEELEIFDR